MCVQGNTCENVHAVVSNKTWEQPKCPLTREWINKACGMFFKKWNIIQPVGQVQRGLFLYCPRAKNGLTILKCYLKKDDTTDAIYGLQSLKYLLSALLQKKFAVP